MTNGESAKDEAQKKKISGYLSEHYLSGPFELLIEVIEEQGFQAASRNLRTQQDTHGRIFVYDGEKKVAQTGKGASVIHFYVGQGDSFWVDFRRMDSLFSNTDSDNWIPKPALSFLLSFVEQKFYPAHRDAKKKEIRDALTKFEYRGSLNFLIEVIEDGGFSLAPGAEASYRVERQTPEISFVWKGAAVAATYQLDRNDHDPRAFDGAGLILTGNFRYPVVGGDSIPSNSPLSLNFVKLLEYHEKVFLPAYAKRSLD